MTRQTDNPAYALFKRLVSTLEIREKSKADRDRKLYYAVRDALGMGTMTPSAFFADNEAITEMQVLTAFLDTFESFSKMIEAVFALCSGTSSGATGGKDLAIRYDNATDSLRFDIDAYKRYRRIWQQVRGNCVTPRYHSDYIPMYEHIVKELLRGGSGLRFRDEAPVVPCTEDELSELIVQAKSAGDAHIALLDEFFSTIARHDPSDDEVEKWFTDHGVEGMYIPRTPDRVQFWRSSISAGLQLLVEAEAHSILDEYPHDDVARIVQRLRECIKHISVMSEGVGLQEAVEEWLSLPYWKKRWQVYEMWVFAECQRTLLNAGGRFDLKPGEELILRTGAPEKAKGILPLSGVYQLELWCEYPLTKGRKRSLRLDLGFILCTPQARLPLSFIECKQRVGVSSASMLDDASKYLPFMPPATTHLLVNFDPYESCTTLMTTDDVGRRITALGNVQPDMPALSDLQKHIRALLPSGRSYYLVLDTTGSMHSKLSDVADHCKGLAATLRAGDVVKLILYGDHNDDYVVKEYAEMGDALELADAVRNAPLTNGGDTPEALEDALHYVREDLLKQRHSAFEIVVFADAPAHHPEECPHGYDFGDELRQLGEMGVSVTLVACGADVDKLGWQGLPYASVTTMEHHEWLKKAENRESIDRTKKGHIHKCGSE